MVARNSVHDVLAGRWAVAPDAGKGDKVLIDHGLQPARNPLKCFGPLRPQFP
jgi:hypothetical protein